MLRASSPLPPSLTENTLRVRSDALVSSACGNAFPTARKHAVSRHVKKHDALYAFTLSMTLSMIGAATKRISVRNRSLSRTTEPPIETRAMDVRVNQSHASRQKK